MTLPHGFGDTGHTSPRETCKKCNPSRKMKAKKHNILYRILLAIGVLKVKEN